MFELIEVLSLFVIYVIAFYFFYIILFQVSNIVSHFGVYHKIDYSTVSSKNKAIIWHLLIKEYLAGFFCSILSVFDNDDSEDLSKGEVFSSKITKLTKLYIILSVLLMFSFYTILTNQLVPFNINISNAYLVSITLSIITLLIIRILSNPSSLPKFVRYFPDKTDLLVEQHRERVISFLYSFVCTNVFLFFLIIGYYAYSRITFPFNVGLNIDAILLFIYYIILLFFAELMGELYLIHKEPIHSI